MKNLESVPSCDTQKSLKCILLLAALRIVALRHICAVRLFVGFNLHVHAIITQDNTYCFSLAHSLIKFILNLYTWHTAYYCYPNDRARCDDFNNNNNNNNNVFDFTRPFQQFDQRRG